MNTIKKPGIKYIALMAMFLVGAGSAVAFQTHAQSAPAAVTSATTSSVAPVTTNSTADSSADVETNDGPDTGVKGTEVDTPESATDVPDAKDATDVAGDTETQD
jgi:hypothetical protein